MGSYDRGSPTTFAPNQVIKGWTEAMQLMVEGDKWELYIPSDMAYGDRGRPPKIDGGACLIFTIEIIKIKGAKVPKVELRWVSAAGHHVADMPVKPACVLSDAAERRSCVRRRPQAGEEWPYFGPSGVSLAPHIILFRVQYRTIVSGD